MASAGLRYLRDVADSKTLNDLRTPFVVVSASGMCEGGRVLHHLRNGIADGRNLVLLAGYQAENTLGRRIMERRQEVKIFDEMIPLRAEVATLAELSGHADQGGTDSLDQAHRKQTEESVSGAWRT